MAGKGFVLIDVLFNTDGDVEYEDHVPSFWVILSVPIYPLVGDIISFSLDNVVDYKKNIREFENSPITMAHDAYLEDHQFVVKKRVFEPDGSISYHVERL